MKNKATTRPNGAAAHTCLTHTANTMSRYYGSRTTCVSCERRALLAFASGDATPWNWAALDVMWRDSVELSALGVGKWLRKDARKVEQILWRVWVSHGGMRLSGADIAVVESFAGQARKQREIARLRFERPRQIARLGELS